MTSRRDFLTIATTIASAGPAFPDLGPILSPAARHRQVFGVRPIDDGLALHQMKNTLNAYEFARGEGPGTMHTVAVFYGTSVALALDDDAWKTYRIATTLATLGQPLERPGNDGNPFLHAVAVPGVSNPADPRSSAEDASVSALVSRGARFLVCDNSLTTFALSTITAEASHASVDAVLGAFRRHLVDGAILVPAGVAALNEAQEHRYTYVAV